MHWIKNLFLLGAGLFIFQHTPKCQTPATTGAAPIYYSPGGTYTDWYFPTSAGYESLEWTFVPVADPPESLAKEGLLHYYAYNFGLVNASAGKGGGYAGFQTNGIFKNRQQGKVINFSIWGSNGGHTNGMLNAGNEESGGYQIMYKFNWIVGHPYYFELKEGPGGVDPQGKWWGLWVTDQTTKQQTFIGEQRVAATIGDKPSILWAAHTSMFGEDLHWWRSLSGAVKYTDPKKFQPSAMAIINISANGGKIKPVKFSYYHNSGQPVKADNGFKSVNSRVSIYTDSSRNVQHNLGTWVTPAPDYLEKLK